MKLVTATTSLTLASERLVQPLGRRADVCRTFVASTGDAFAAGWLGRDADLHDTEPQPRMVLQMVGPLSGRRCQRLARPIACAQPQPAGYVGRVAPNDCAGARSAGTAAWAARTLPVGRRPDHPPRIGMCG